MTLPPELELRTVTAAADSAGQRLDLFIGNAFQLSRARTKQLFESGDIRVDGRSAKKGQRVEAGQTISVKLVVAPLAAVAHELPALRLLYQDASLIFVDKPAGVPSHPLKPGETGTVANALVARFPECLQASTDPREGGLCHRLDIETSGVLMAARDRATWETLRQAFTERAVDKRYIALVTGPLADEGEIELPLRHHPRHADRVEPALEGEDPGRPAHSVFHVLWRQGEYSLVEVRILTGVLHQVRAHLAAIGAPLVGDTLYGGRPEPLLSRFFLHAASLQIRHPSTGHALRVESELPAELVEVLRARDIPTTPLAL